MGDIGVDGKGKFKVVYKVGGFRVVGDKGFMVLCLFFLVLCGFLIEKYRVMLDS